MMDAGGDTKASEGIFVVLREGRDFSSINRTHDFLKDAQDEAERLVRKENRAFTVYSLKIEGVCMPADSPVKWSTPPQ